MLYRHTYTMARWRLERSYSEFVLEHARYHSLLPGSAPLLKICLKISLALPMILVVDSTPPCSAAATRLAFPFVASLFAYPDNVPQLA